MTTWQWVAFGAFWSVILALTVANHDSISRGQAYVRAATVPLGIAALALAFDRFRFDRLASWRIAVPAIAALLAVQLFYVLGRGSLVALALAVVFAASMLLLAATSTPLVRGCVLIVLLTLVASEFTFHYVDYLFSRIGPIPASALVLAVRSIAASLVILGACAAARLSQQVSSRLDDETLQSVAIVGVAIVELAYFFIDWFTDPRLRFVHVAAVVIAAFGVVAMSKPDRGSALRPGPLTAVGLLCLMGLQFAYFYAQSL